MDANIGFPPPGQEPENLNPVQPKKEGFDKSKSAFQRVKPGEQPPAQTKIQLGKRGGQAALRIGQKAITQLGVEASKNQDPLERISAKMRDTLDLAEKSLKKAMYDPNLDVRLEQMPQIPQAKGLAGSYFVGGKTNPLLIIKPHIQEPGMAGTVEKAAYPGIKAGSGAIRERMAYALQEALGFSCGIPETTCHTFSHEMLGIPSENTKKLQLLKELTGMSFTREEVVKLFHASPDETFATAAEELIKKKLESLVPNAKMREKFLDIAKSAPSLSDLRRQIISKDVARICFCFSHMLQNKPKIEEAAKSIYTAVSTTSAKPPNPQLASAQCIEKGCISLDEISYGENQGELELIPQSEIEKFLIDCILFNMDRHLGNALLRKVTLSEIDEKCISASDSEKERLLEMKLHAQNKHSDYAYELILIDHGTIAPEHAFDEVFAKFEWRSLDQTENALTERTKNRILNLDPAILIDKVRKDQKVFEAKYGTPCSVSERAYAFMRFSCMVLQEGVRQNMTMFRLAEHYEGITENGLLTLFQNEVEGKDPVNWSSIQNKIATLTGQQ